MLWLIAKKYGMIMLLGHINPVKILNYNNPRWLMAIRNGTERNGYASVVYAVVVCPSVHLSVSLSQASTVPKCPNAGSCKQCYMIARDYFSDAKDLGEIPTGSPSMRLPNRGGVGSNWWFSTNISLCLKNSARQGHSYYGMLIGTHMRCIKWHYFKWPWVTN